MELYKQLGFSSQAAMDRDRERWEREQERLEEESLNEFYGCEEDCWDAEGNL